MAKRKTCKGVCGRQYALDSFPKSASAKDGRLGYCAKCWGDRMRSARKKTLAKIKPGDEGRDTVIARKVGRPPKASQPPDGLGVFNQALAAANGSREIWEVIADDGERKEYRGRTARKKAYKQSLLWMIEGYGCTLREIHEYQPTLRLEILD